MNATKPLHISQEKYDELKAEEDRINSRYLCDCGSGHPYERQYDGYGIYLCRTCPSCHEEKMGGYRSDIHEHYQCDEQIEDDY